MANRRHPSLSERRLQAEPKKSQRAVPILALALAAGLVSLQGIAVGAWADGTGVGATITNPAHGPVGSGGSQTDFSVALPTGAACSRDTATGRYQVYSYVVPSSTNPLDLSWDPNGPRLPLKPPDNDTHALYDNTGKSYTAINTAIHTGQVPQDEAFRLTQYTIDGSRGMSLALPAGTYNVGLACVTDKLTTDKYWNVQLTFAPNGNDPNRETWTVVPGSGSQGSSTRSSTSSATGATISSSSTAPQASMPSVTSPSIPQDSPGSPVAGAALRPLRKGGRSTNSVAIAGAAVLVVAALGILLFAGIRRAARRASTRP